MSTHFSSNQFESAFVPQRLQNYEVPKRHKESPSTRKGATQIISNDRGHITSVTSRSSANPWGHFLGTWQIPRRPLQLRTKSKFMTQQLKGLNSRPHSAPPEPIANNPLEAGGRPSSQQVEGNGLIPQSPGQDASQEKASSSTQRSPSLSGSADRPGTGQSVHSQKGSVPDDHPSPGQGGSRPLSAQSQISHKSSRYPSGEPKSSCQRPSSHRQSTPNCHTSSQLGSRVQSPQESICSQKGSRISPMSDIPQPSAPNSRPVSGQLRPSSHSRSGRSSRIQSAPHSRLSSQSGSKIQSVQHCHQATPSAHSSDSQPSSRPLSRQGSHQGSGIGTSQGSRVYTTASSTVRSNIPSPQNSEPVTVHVKDIGIQCSSVSAE